MFAGDPSFGGKEQLQKQLTRVFEAVKEAEVVESDEGVLCEQNPPGGGALRVHAFQSQQY